MKNAPIAALASLALLPIAHAQTSVEDFENGNPDAWEIWFSVYNSVRSTGGNPGAYLELDNFTQGPLTCHFVELFPDGNAGQNVHLHSGNWRTSGVTEVTIDLRIDEGPVGGNLELQLISDPGTPGNANDDCIISTQLVGVMPTQGTWVTLTIPVPSIEPALPLDWVVDGNSPCANTNVDAAWNAVMQDVDQMRFVYDDGSGAFCSFNSWIIGADNISVVGGGPGSNYCQANANSTGVPARMAPTGTALISNNDMTLRCEDMPANTFAIFLVADQQAITPIIGSEGILCLGGQIGRYSQPGQILNAGPAGEVALPIDLQMIPQPSSFATTMPGQTWNFSCWFRDISSGGMQTSNLADGYEVTFQ